MKKIVSMILVTVMTLSLAACGSNESTNNDGSEKTSEQSETSSVEQDENSIILDEPFVICDDEIATAEITQFYKENEECYVAIKIHNNSDREFLFNFDEAYLGDDALQIVLQTGNNGPAPGKTLSHSFKLNHDTKPEATPLEDINMLYDLEGKISISVFTEDGEHLDGSMGKEYTFSLKEGK